MEVDNVKPQKIFSFFHVGHGVTMPASGRQEQGLSLTETAR